MSFNGNISSKFKALFSKPVNSALNALAEIISGEGSKSGVSKELIILVKAVLMADGEIDKEEIAAFKRHFSKHFSDNEIERLVVYFKSPEKPDIGKTASALAPLPEEEKLAFLMILIQMAYSNRKHRYSDIQKKMIAEICESFGIDADALSEIEEKALRELERRDRILKSGTGIIVVLVIILIFILTATFLKSVLFGLVLAYLFLPLEKWYERIFSGNSLFIALFSFFSWLAMPFRKLSETVGKFFRKKEKTSEISSENKEEQLREALINKACAATVSTALIVILVVLSFVIWLSGYYVKGLKDSVTKYVKTHSIVHQKSSARPDTQLHVENTALPEPSVKTEANNKKITDIPTAAVKKNQAERLQAFWKARMKEIESLKPRLEEWSWFRWAKEKTAEFLKNDDNMKKLLMTLLSKTGGVFSFTAGFLGRVVSILLNTFLTIFFFSLFLKKIALFNSGAGENRSVGDYLVGTIFISSWMPDTSNDAREEAKNILDEIISKLRTWVRGYFSIIVVEMILFNIAFILQGVPYAVILGCIAGFTILLPYIGPISSASLTILVCFAAKPGVSMSTILGIGLTYVAINGIIEQLFLYPTLVGGALGLTMLETIIVVLLGGLFAGIPGMIFALPTAAVLKYLIPKIYEFWSPPASV